MNATQFYTEWDKRCERAVRRDIIAFQRRRYNSLSDFDKHMHDRLVAESGPKIDALIERLMAEKGWDADYAEDVAIEVIEAELEREFEARGYNDRVA